METRFQKELRGRSHSEVKESSTSDPLLMLFYLYSLFFLCLEAMSS